MLYITRNYKVDLDDEKAFSLYENDYNDLLFTCNYYEMCHFLQLELEKMLDEKLITHQQAWDMREDYIAYNELVEIFAE